MSFGKTLGVTAGIFVVLNFIFMIIAAAVGLLGVSSVGDLFSVFAANDPVIFISMMLIPFASPINGSILFLSLASYDIAISIVGLLWVLVPGLVATIVGGWKFADESSKTGFWGTFLGIFIPMLIVTLLEIFGVVSGLLTGLIVSDVLGGFILLFYSFLTSCFFAGFGAMVSSNLY